MVYVDSKAQQNVMNVNLFVVLDDGELCSVHTGGTLTSINWDAMLAGDMSQEHLAITHHRFSTASEKYDWLNTFRGFGVGRLPEHFEGEFTIPLYVPRTPDVRLTNGPTTPSRPATHREVRTASRVVEATERSPHVSAMAVNCLPRGGAGIGAHSVAASEASVIKVAERTIARMACLRSAESIGQEVITSASFFVPECHRLTIGVIGPLPGYSHVLEHVP